MTREEALSKSIMTLIYFQMHFCKSKEAFDNTQAIIDTLERIEQEPILDKIRTELHATAEMHEDGNYYIRDEWIDEYFDKYKAEGSDKE